RELLKASALGAAAQVTASTWAGSAFAQAGAATDPDLARVGERRRLLIKGGVVLSLDRQVGDFAEADVLVEGNKIREVRPNITASDDVVVIDAANRIVIPGFIDTHNHTYQGLLRGTLANGLLNPDYNRDVQNILTPAYTAADAYAGVLLTALGMIDIGTTGI